MNVYFKILLFTLVTVLVQHLGRLAYIYLSLGNTIVKHYPGKCEHVKGFTTRGSEDMTLLPSGQLIITSGLGEFGDHYDYSNTGKGQLYIMDTNSDTGSVSKLTLKGWPADSNFEPHGLHHWVHENKSVSIFVVLHMPERVGRFLYDGEKAVTLTKIYENSIYMRNINSVFCTGEDSFYLTNILHARFRDTVMANVEFLLYIPMSNVLYVEGDDYMKAADGFHFSNGLIGNNKHVYLATKDAVRVFTMNADNTLQPFKTIPVSIGSIDNLKLDASGNLWLGCQNIMEEVLEYMKDPFNRKCHSTVMRVRDPTGVAEVESVFVDDRSLIQGASGGVYTNGKLLIGSINDKMVSCDVNYLSGQ